MMINLERSNEEPVSISKLASSLQITPRTLRCWEDFGLIESVPRLPGKLRYYSHDMVRRIHFIIKLKELGLTLKELQNLYTAYGESKRTNQMIPTLLQILDEHINLIDEKLPPLASLRSDLVKYRRHISAKKAIYAEEDRHSELL